MESHFKLANTPTHRHMLLSVAKDWYRTPVPEEETPSTQPTRSATL